MSNSTLGYGRSRLDVQVYEFDVLHGEDMDNGHMKMAVTKNCIPVIVFMEGDFNGGKFSLYILFVILLVLYTLIFHLHVPHDWIGDF